MNTPKNGHVGHCKEIKKVQEDMSKTAELIDRLASLELTLINHMTVFEKHVAILVEGDRNQLDVFIEEIKPQLQELKRDIKWLKAKWEKFST